MKKILLFVLIFICLKSFGQYPTKQTLGTDSTIITSKGSLQSRIINKSFSDTTQANTQRIKFYDGAQIWTTSDNNFWLRDSANNKWVLPGGGIGTIDSLIVATQTDIAQTSTYSPVAFDTLERKVLLNGAVTGRDEAFPSVERLPNGSLVVGWASTIAHATLGMGKYMTSPNDGLNWTAPVTLEADPNWNYRNLIFSRTRGDTTAVHYWSAFSNRIYLRHSINSLSSISTKDSITSSVVLASEGKIVNFLGYNVIPVYSFAPDVPKAGVIYKNVLTGGTWTFLWFPSSDGLQLSEGELIVEGDTLFYFLRSDANPTIMYRAYTTNLTSWSTPAAATPTEWTAGAPRVIRLQDGRYFINYRTTDGSAPDEGAYAVSNDRGRTWTKVGEQQNRLWAYGSTIPIGDAIYLNVYSGQLSLDGTLYQDVFSFPGTDFVNNGKTIQRNDLRWDWIKHLIDRKDSTSAGRDLGLNGRFNVVPGTTGVDYGINFLDASTQAAAGLTYTSDGLEVNVNNVAAPTVWERRAKFYSKTATGTDPVFDIGIGADPYIRFLQDGTIRSTKPRLVTGAGAYVFQNDASAAPSGLSGVGIWIFRAGSAGFITSQLAGGAYSNLNLYSSLFTFNGAASFLQSLNLGPGVTFLLNGSAGTAGQVVTSAGPGLLPTWGAGGSGGVTTMQAIGATPNANGATISGTDLNLQPYSASFGGVTTTGAQTGAGDKTWTGEAKFTSNFLQQGGGLHRLEITGSGVPAGSTGVGIESFVAGGTSYISSVSRPAATYAPLVFFGSTIGFNGVATFNTTLNLAAGVPITFNGNAGTAGQVPVSAGAGALPVWTNQSSIVGATPTLQQVKTAGSTLTTNTTVSLGSTDFAFQGNNTNTWGISDMDEINLVSTNLVIPNIIGIISDDTTNNKPVIVESAGAAGTVGVFSSWAKMFSYAGVGSADLSFETLTYSATPSVAFDPDRPNKQFTLTGNIAITNTGTVNGSSGMYLIIQDGTGNRTVSINGTSIPVNPVITSATLIAWAYNGTIYMFDKNAGSSLSGSATLDFGSTVAGTSTDLTVTVTGAADGDPVSIGVPNGSTLSNGVFTAWVSAANTVTIRFSNNSLAATLDPASGTFKVNVVK